MKIRLSVVVLLAMALQVLFLASPPLTPKAEGQRLPACGAFDEASLVSCIENYNLTPDVPDYTIGLTADITLTGALPAFEDHTPVGNDITHPEGFGIFGRGHTIDGGLVVDHVLVQHAHDSYIYDVIITGALDSGIELTGGTMYISGSTITGNDQGFRADSDTTITNSTIANNGTGVSVGDSGSVILRSVTVAHNVVGGIVVETSGAAEVAGSLISSNGIDCSVSGTLVDIGGSVFGDTSCTGTLTPGLVGSFSDTLGSNGTLAIDYESPAKDADTACAGGNRDQRDSARPSGRCDAGAFEFNDNNRCNGLVITINMNTNGGDGMGTPGDDVILGTSGNDQISGLQGDDVICSLGGRDRIWGGPGADWIFGAPGADAIWGGPGPDTINGGDGPDQLFGDDGYDRITGSTGSDIIEGGNGNDWIWGGPAFDIIKGQAGDDLLLGGDEADDIFGGPGNDKINGMNADDFVDGGDGFDQIWGGLGDDHLKGGGGFDWIWGRWGQDTIEGGHGDDSLFGEGSADIMYGGPGNDLINGGIGTDRLHGNAGNDTIEGGDQDDSLYGDSGNDSLDGGFGSDLCDGTTGTDTAVRCETETNIP